MKDFPFLKLYAIFLFLTFSLSYYLYGTIDEGGLLYEIEWEQIITAVIGIHILVACVNLLVNKFLKKVLKHKPTDKIIKSFSASPSIQSETAPFVIWFFILIIFYLTKKNLLKPFWEFWYGIFLLAKKGILGSGDFISVILDIFLYFITPTFSLFFITLITLLILSGLIYLLEKILILVGKKKWWDSINKWWDSINNFLNSKTLKFLGTIFTWLVDIFKYFSIVIISILIIYGLLYFLVHIDLSFIF